MTSQLVDCYSGNPLRNPTIQTDETFVGTPWPDFNESTVVIVEPAAVDVTEFVLVDVADGNEFVRPTGSTGEADLAANSTTVSPEETAESAAPTPTATPAPITRELNMVGLVDVNSTISAEISRDDNELIFEFDASPGAMLQLNVANDRASVGTIAIELRREGLLFEFFRVPAGVPSQQTSHSIKKAAADTRWWLPAGPQHSTSLFPPRSRTMLARAEMRELTSQTRSRSKAVARLLVTLPVSTWPTPMWSTCKVHLRL